MRLRQVACFGDPSEISCQCASANPIPPDQGLMSPTHDPAVCCDTTTAAFVLQCSRILTVASYFGSRLHGSEKSSQPSRTRKLRSPEVEIPLIGSGSAQDFWLQDRCKFSEDELDRLASMCGMLRLIVVRSNYFLSRMTVSVFDLLEYGVFVLHRHYMYHSRMLPVLRERGRANRLIVLTGVGRALCSPAVRRMMRR